MEELRKKTIERLRTDPAIQQYLSQFSSSSTDSFINGYASKLTSTLEYGNMYMNMHESHSTEYIKRASKCLEDIQMKKLFDLRCQWGANLVHVPGVEISADFYTLSNNIMNTDVVPPITQEEFDLYLEYARSSSFVHNSWGTDWTSVEDIRSDNMGEDSDLPEWFVYHNLHTGSNIHLQLPDLRGDKEEEYRLLWRKEEDEKLEKKYESGEIERHVPDKRPRISDLHYADVLDFMKKFENAETVRLFEAMVEYGSMGIIKEDEEDNDDDWLDEQVDNIMHKLTTLKDVRLPVEANRDWRKALIAAWEKFEQKQTVAALPAAYDNYLFMLESKIAFPVKDRDVQSFSDSIKKQILRGRELNGEPRDLNF